MTDLRKAAQQALEALTCPGKAKTADDQAAITALRAALAEPQTTHWEGCESVHPECEALAEPQPVAWMCPDDPERETAFAWNAGHCDDCGKQRVPLYAAPTPRKPLTDAEIERLWTDEWDGFVSLEEATVIARAIEAAHGITGDSK